MQSKMLNDLKKPQFKCVAAAIVFHIIYSFIFAMIIGPKNPMLFLLEYEPKSVYMFLIAFFAALPYLLSGYLITLSRNDQTGLKEKNKGLFFKLVFPIIIVYIVTLILQAHFQFRNMYQFLFFIDYPVTSHLLLMKFSDYSQNLILMFIILLPPIMVYLGGLIRINQLSKEGYNE